MRQPRRDAAYQVIHATAPDSSWGACWMGPGGPSRVMDGGAFPGQRGTGASSCQPQQLSWTGQARKHTTSGPSCSPGFEMLLAAGSRQETDRFPERGAAPGPRPGDTVDAVGANGVTCLFIREIDGAMPVLGAGAAAGRSEKY